MKTEEEIMNRLRQLQKEEHEMSDKQFLHDGSELQARERELERVLELSEEEVRKMWLVVLI